MGNLKSLAGQTVIYGFSTILGRLLNWLLLPLYVRYMTEGENGMITYLYSFIAIIQVILSFGFETGFFRFANKQNVKVVFSTLYSFVAIFSFLFVLLAYIFNKQIAAFSDINDGSLVVIVALVLAVDSISNIPFALLRYNDKALKYSLNRLMQVIVIVSLNLFFLLYYPTHISSFTWLRFLGVSESNKVFNVIYANFIGSLFIPIVLFKSTLLHFCKLSFNLLKEVLNYSYPILIVGLFGMVNYNLDKILLPHLMHGDNSFGDLGIYGANYKIGVLMAIFTQSFRMAFEPFLFKNRSDNDNSVYGLIMNYFVGFGMIIFVGVMLSLDIVNILITDKYSSGNIVIPFVLLGQLFFGIYYNLSLWYKVIDKTYFGLIFTIVGSIVIVFGNVLLVPMLGYVGAALSTLICNLVMMVLSYFIGQRHLNIPYDLSKFFWLIAIGMLVYYLSLFNQIVNIYLKMTVNYLFLLGYIVFVWMLINKGFRPNFFKINSSR